MRHPRVISNITRYIILLLVNLAVSNKCGYPGQPVNGYVENTKTSYYVGEAVEYRCNTDHVLFGSVSRVCRGNGTWSSVLPLCDQSLKVLGKAYTSEGIANNDAVLALDKNINNCAVMGTSDIHWWRVDLGVKHHVLAVRVSMGRQALDQNFNIYVIADDKDQDTYRRCASFAGRFATTTVILACDEGRGLSGRYVHIEDTRSEPKFFILCEVEIYILKEAYPCGEPEVAFHSKIVKRNEKEVHYTCPKGFKMLGPKVRHCNQSGAWSEHEPTCLEVVCPVMQPVQHGILRLTGIDPRKMIMGTVVQFSCHHGYVLQGNKTRVCNERGQWSGGETACLPVDCKSPRSSNPGEYFVLVSGATTLLSRAKLQCTDGYNKSMDATIVCEARGKWNYSRITVCLPIDQVAEIVEAHSLHFTTGIIIGIIAMSLVILCIFMALFLVKWRRKKNGSVMKDRTDQANCSISPSASSLIARGHYTPAEEIIWANDGFYCELPVQSVDHMVGHHDTAREQTTSLAPSDKVPATTCKSSLKNGDIVKSNLNRSQPSRETIYEEITKRDDDKPAKPPDEPNPNLNQIPDDPILNRNQSEHSISELYAKVDFNKKRESRLLHSLASSPQSSFDSTKGSASRSLQVSNGPGSLDSDPGLESPTGGFRELPPIPADQESISSTNSSQNDTKQDKASLAMKLLDDAVYAPTSTSEKF